MLIVRLEGGSDPIESAHDLLARLIFTSRSIGEASSQPVDSQRADGLGNGRQREQLRDRLSTDLMAADTAGPRKELCSAHYVCYLAPSSPQ